MNERDDLAEQLVELIDSSARPLGLDDVLERVRGARSAARAPKAGRFAAIGLAVVVVVAAAVVVVNTRSTSTERQKVTVVPSTGEPTVSTTTSGPSVASQYANATPTGVMGGIGPGSGWRLDGLSLSRTDDEGATWRDITPPSAVNQDPIARINWVEFLDSQHVWVPVALNHAPFTIYRSDDGGETWQAVCVGNQCPYVAVTFIDPDHGWGIRYAPGGRADSGNLYSTGDGGHTWTLVGPTPFTGPMHFLDVDRGWAVSEPSGYGGSSGSATKGGGDLYRTDDGGRTWHPFPLDIGGKLHFGVPQWFGNDGVVAAWSEPGEDSGRHDQVRVYTTHDGGQSWTGQVAPPSGPTSDRYGNSPMPEAPQLPFSASSPSDWMLFIGPNLYVTHDAGAHWSTITPTPAIGKVYSLALTGESSAWALAMVPTCDDPSATQPSCRLEVLVHTRDGGRSWPALSLP